MSISTNLAVLLLQVTGAFFFLIVVCEFGARITYAHDEIYSVILQLSWYNFPVELQSILPFVISIAQKGVVVYGYGSVACSRETFKRVGKIKASVPRKMKFLQLICKIEHSFFTDYQVRLFVLYDATPVLLIFHVFCSKATMIE